jgi:hypothetical protein
MNIPESRLRKKAARIMFFNSFCKWYELIVQITVLGRRACFPDL